MQRKVFSFLVLLALVAGYLTPLATPALKPLPVRADAGTIVLDGLLDADYVKIASDPKGDLGEPGGWNGTYWTDLTDLYVAADATTLYVYASLYAYTSTVSSGQIGLVLDVDGNPNAGGSSDPWGNAITFEYDSVDGADTLSTMLPDYVIRGNLANGEGGGDNGWTELRAWNGVDWDGSGTNWGGIGGKPTMVGSKIAYSDTHGVEFAIPLADIGNPDPVDVHLQVFSTQSGPGTKGAYDTVPSDNQSAGWSNATTENNLVSVPLAVDPAQDLNLGWNGVDWTDMTRMHIWADHTNLHLFIPSTYTTTVSTGQIALVIDTKSGGGSTDPWGNAITLAYTTTHQNLGSAPVVTTNTILPDYFIRGNIYNTLSGGDAGNGWTEMRTWNGTDWNTGGDADWGGIGNTVQPATGSSNIAWSDGEGLRVTIPFADISVSGGDTINLQFMGTQGGGTKGAYDTVPADDQATGWEDGTTQEVFATYTIPEVSSPGASPDNAVWWTELGHNSRDEQYRTPFGAVTTGVTVTLRLRAANHDLTGAKVRIWDDRQNTQTIMNMQRVAADDVYEWWEAKLPVGDEPTIYWYRFIAIDGTDTDYYEDDSGRTGGWGQTFDESQDNAWQLTVYDPDYATPDWVKNAVIYQIFPDRFRNGDDTNDTPDGTFFYDEAGGTIYQSDTTNWNTVICDPRDAEGCPNMWSQNFYGGDLQGIVDKLDYLDDLGVTALYLNPVFESPSNHKYDTTDFSMIDDNFGDLSTFITLTTEAHNRGIHVILDGVFNHTSSDSIYFDRYGRYDSVGACESIDSPYRSWYYFEDVDPGEGECVGSDGTPNGATYESWFGYDSLPKLRANDTAVRELIWSEGTDSIAPYWMQWADGWRLDVAGDVDPGKTNEDPSDLNSYWEGFRDAVRTENPETYIVGEEWGNSTPWLLGAEWDASMNYQFGTAIMGFWRDETFTDNDHNVSSSAGTIAPLTPSQLDERLHYLEERYPPESFYAMMNLLGSHDTNRALFMLDHNTDLNDRSIYEDPDYDWSDAIERLKGVVLLQFTLPGAPTVYYGDEVGLVGPSTYAGAKWEDDPYNRMPYPWLDESGTPYYTHLQTQNGQDVLRDYYKLLTGARNTHPALRTGSFDTQLVDDENGIYVFGRKWISGTVSDAALVIANQGGQQDVTVDLSGYLPAGTQLEDVLDNNEMYTTTMDGELTVTGVPTMSGAVLVLANGLADPPEAVTDLAVTEEGSHELTLEWSAATDAGAYIVYRSQVSNGGYTAISTTTALSYTDTGLDNATWYYYVVVSKDNATLLTSGNSNEASGMPHDTIGWANLGGPDEITHTLGITPTGLITGQVYIDGVTPGDGAGEGVLAQLGYGPATTEPVSWTLWVDAMYFGEMGSNDVYSATLQPETVGEYHYVYRYSTTAGRDWVYADRSGMIAPDTAPLPGILHVEASADTTPPAAPQNLKAINWGVGHITIHWDAVSDSDLYAYDIYREGGGTRAPAAKIARVLAPTTVYTDETVTNNQTYTYTIYALDNAFNQSAASNAASATAKARLVETRFIVKVAPFTPAGDTVYIAGNNAEVFGASFSADRQPMTPLGDNMWSYSVDVMDGTDLQYKFTRGSWDTVENWGTIKGLANRELTVEYGSTGVLTVTDTVYNWHDPLVWETYPLANATNWDTAQPVTALLTRKLDTTRITSATFVVEEIGVGTVAGELGFTHPALQYVDPTYGTLNVTGTLVTFTPTVALSTANGYEVALEREGYVDEGQMQKDYSWAFGILLPELTVEKSVTPTTGVQPGDMVTYTLVIKNHGAGNAAGVVLTDELPSLLQFDSWVNQGSALLPLPGDTITWGPYAVPASSEYTLSFRATLTETQLASQVITNTAEYDSENAGSGLAPAAFAVQGTVPEPNLVLTKAVVPDADIEAGAIVTYTITLENTGTATAAGIQLTDTLPLSVTFGSFVTGTNVTPVYSSGTITWTGDLATGVQPIAIIFTATVGSGVPGATVTNEVSITADNAAGDMVSATFTYLGYNKIFLPVVMRSN
ncbi:MAG: DUF11 domain-containing protein [Anaerolineae bacterium]|nr:DUF11 domain-containing protein [Anaerolineae bacterium]